MRRLVTALALAALSACTCASPPSAPPSTNRAPDAPAVAALWSPAEGVLPFPDALPLDPRAYGVVAATPDPVRAALLAFVVAHAGAPADTPAAVELSGPVDPTTAARGVALLRADPAGVERVDADVDVTLGKRGLRIRPRAPLVVGARYVVVVAGGTSGIQGLASARAAAGPVVASAAFAYAAGRTDDVAAVPGGRAGADAVRALRPLVAALLDDAEAAGCARDDVALAFAWTVTDRPRVALDLPASALPASRAYVGPWPSDLALDASARTTLPPADLSGMLDAAALGRARDAVAEVAGFSTSARIRIPLAGRADGTAGFALFDLDALAPVDVDAALSADASTVFLRKHPALLAGHRYAIVVHAGAGGARAGGSPILPSLASALIRSTGPLALDGRSTTALLDDDGAVTLESARAKVAPLLDALDAHAASDGIARADSALAVPFTTLDAYAFVDARARLLVDRAIDPAAHDVVAASPWDRGLYAVMPNVDTVVSGTFTSLDFLDPVTLRASAAGPVASEVPFVLTLPPRAPGTGPPPVVVFGHGLVTAKELAFLIADLLAQHGFATFAIDLPYHGARTVCLVDAHCDLFQTCTEDHRCVDGAGDAGGLASGDSPWPDGPSIPLATGQAFVLVDDLVASRDHFLQGMVDLRQSVRVLQSGALDVDGADLSWLGISLGGIFGASIAGASDEIHTLALNVPGADLVVTLEDSSALAPLLQQQLAAHHVDKPSAAYADYEDVAHLVLDPVDPLNLAPRATVAVPEGWAHKRLLLQMADTDLVVPNAATRILSAAVDVGVSEYHPLISNHGFLLDPTSLEGARGRDEVVRFLEAR